MKKLALLFLAHPLWAAEVGAPAPKIEVAQYKENFGTNLSAFTQLLATLKDQSEIEACLSAHPQMLALRDHENLNLLHHLCLEKAPGIEWVALHAPHLIDERDKYDRTPLMLACMSGNFQAFKILVARGKPQPKNYYEKLFTLAIAYARHFPGVSGHLDVFKELEKIFPQLFDAEKHNYLLLAIDGDSIDMVKYLIDQHEELIDIKDSADGSSILLFACATQRKNSEQIVKLLLQKRPKMILHLSDQGITPMQIAVSKNNFEIVKLLYYHFICDYSALIHEQTGHTPSISYLFRTPGANKTVFQFACQKGFFEIAKFLDGVEPSLSRDLTSSGENCIHLAIQSNNKKLITYLVKKYPSLARSSDIPHCSGLDYAFKTDTMEIYSIIVPEHLTKQFYDSALSDVICRACFYNAKKILSHILKTATTAQLATITIADAHRPDIIADPEHFDTLAITCPHILQERNGKGGTYFHELFQAVSADSTLGLEYLKKMVLLLLQYGLDPYAHDNNQRTALSLLDKKYLPLVLQMVSKFRLIKPMILDDLKLNNFNQIRAFRQILQHNALALVFSRRQLGALLREKIIEYSGDEKRAELLSQIVSVIKDEMIE